MESLEQAELNIWHGVHRCQPLFEDQQLGAVFKMYTRVRADKNVPGCFWVMTAKTRTEGIIPFFPEVHYTSSGGVARDKLGEP